ncbi:VOC family protein [Erythrobacter alti]|uniref:VOC family protein n=1 Tax=Erythrobacter alti TaxID=1896145 RepID=UPI0030F3840A
MANQHGDFVWYELMSGDADGAQEFYSGLLGWTFKSGNMDGIDYRPFSAGGGGDIGGLLQLTEEMTEHGARPCWVGYVRVDDVPATVSKAKGAGATVLMEGHEVPEVGPFAMLQDPGGAPFYVIDDRSGQDSDAFASHEPRMGHCAWNELMAGDPDAAKSFYGDLFGWVVSDTMDMGEMGKYEMLRNGAERDFMFGAVMNAMPDMPVSMWSFYFRLPSIDVAEAYIKQNGGQVMNGPMEIPGGEFIINGVDPQGAMFSVIGPRGEG